MPKCPHCKNELKRLENGKLYCSVCNKRYSIKPAVRPTYQPPSDKSAPVGQVPVDNVTQKEIDDIARENALAMDSFIPLDESAAASDQTQQKNEAAEAEDAVAKAGTATGVVASDELSQQANLRTSVSACETEPEEKAADAPQSLAKTANISENKPQPADKANAMRSDFMPVGEAVAPSQKDSEEIELLKARIAALEAGKPKSQAMQKLTEFKDKALASPAWSWIKQHWILLTAATLIFIIFVTLMTCLVGIRGIYVNIEDPNEFYSFDATTYEYHYVTMEGSSAMDRGTWKLKRGNIYFTYKDELFGKSTYGYPISNKGNKVLTIKDNGAGWGFEEDKVYKRISVINYANIAKKAKVSFDFNGGVYNGTSGKASSTTKVGNKVKEPSFEPTKYNCEFRGWYKEPYGYKNGGTRFDEKDSVWEDTVYYANWYNPQLYRIDFSGQMSGYITAHEGDRVIDALKLQYPKYVFYHNDEPVDENLFMPDSILSLRCELADEYLDGTLRFSSVDGGYRVSAKNSYIEGEIIIPLEYNGAKVVQIGSFSNTNITSITIPQDVASINDEAFKDCSQLVSITLPNSIESIGSGAFENCTGLKSVVIPDSVTSIGSGILKGCSGLISITLPFVGESKDSLLPLGYMFEEAYSYNDVKDGFDKIKQVYISKGTDYQGAYSRETSRDYLIPSSLSSIVVTSQSLPYGAFSNCNMLREINVPNANEIGLKAFENTGWWDRLRNGVVYINKALVYSYKGEMTPECEITVDDGAVKILAEAFANQTTLAKITLPSSVK